MQRSKECVNKEGDCLLASRQPHNCRVCKGIRGWSEHADELLIVQEIRNNGMAIYVGQEPHPPLDGEIMRYRTNDESEEQLRVSVNSLLNLANEIWLSDDHVTDRIKDQDGKASKS